MGLSLYTYVEGNPRIRTASTGHDGLFGGLVSAVTTALAMMTASGGRCP